MKLKTWLLRRNKDRELNDTYYSNCLFECIKAKIRGWKDNNIYDWYQEYALKHWWDWIFHKGHIRIRPYEIYERWLETKQ